MPFQKNQFGVPQYPQSDARRLFVLLSAIDLLERPTVSALSDLTGIDKESIDDEVLKLRDQFGVDLHKLGEVYRIDSWGDLLKKNAVKKYLKDGG
ncbi:MAG TPA: hypothetical protein VGU61_21390 [Noviherbaspirillum sp.]|uniref:hypothetical protein n=1 Tax=Noviherbaspirillum sp. TaxID=1926288 RepID=UPI002DDD4E0D|nr:hypothetical protein [Noviherbaspirillum sp.]HEV2612828.1 hypothetical protein [Noviherbaspirillum sp.]